MACPEFEKALEGTREIEITVTGRTSGRQITIPVWFVQEDERVYLLPVRGSDADWYRNLLKNPTIRLAADGAEHTTSVTPITDPARVRGVVDKFRPKYGNRDVEEYYSNSDVAVEVPLA
jgi:deazaflavin-dependent oxidoreductase (nitroreductase family)